MKSPTRSLTKTICDAFGIEKDGEEFSIVFSQTISYLTKGINAFQYQNVLKPFCKGHPFSAKDFRLRLHESRYVSLNLKLFMFRLGRLKSVTLAVAKQIMKELEIKGKDAKRMLQVWDQHAAMRKRIKARAREIPKERLHLLTIEGINHFFSDVVYKPLLRYIQWFVYKKLRFVVDSNNDQFEDFHNDVLAKVVQAFYTALPVVDRTDLHVVNGLKQTVHNHVINIIKSETSQKRGRLVPIGTDAAGNPINRLVVMAENQMPTNGEEDSNSNYHDVHGGTGNNLDRFELEFSITEILSKLRETSKKHRFLKLLMGHDDPEFTAWLQERKIASRSEDNVAVQMKTSAHDFNRLLGEFLNVEEHKLQAFLKRLRSDLALPEHMQKLDRVNA